MKVCSLTFLLREILFHPLIYFYCAVAIGPQNGLRISIFARKLNLQGYRLAYQAGRKTGLDILLRNLIALHIECTITKIRKRFLGGGILLRIGPDKMARLIYFKLCRVVVSDYASLLRNNGGLHLLPGAIERSGNGPAHCFVIFG